MVGAGPVPARVPMIARADTGSAPTGRVSGTGPGEVAFAPTRQLDFTRDIAIRPIERTAQSTYRWK